MDERLVILNEEGVYRLYDLQGDYQQHSLGSEAAETGIVDARIHDNGLVAITGSLSLLEVKGWEGGRPLTLANPGEPICSPCSKHCVIHQNRTVRTPSRLGSYPSRFEYLETCRSLAVCRRYDTVCGQSRMCGSTTFKRTFFTRFTVSKRQGPSPLNLFWHTLGCFNRLPTKHG